MPHEEQSVVPEGDVGGCGLVLSRARDKDVTADSCLGIRQEASSQLSVVGPIANGVEVRDDDRDFVRPGQRWSYDDRTSGL